MMRVAEFEKVSLDRFYEDYSNVFDFTESEILEAYKNVKIPQRATMGSAGYDFVSPHSFVLRPGETITIPSGIRCRITYSGWMLAMFPRSGLGFGFRLQLDNTVGIIDSDYYLSDNEGHIWIKLTNDSKLNKTVHIPAGKAICQGIFIPYGITMTDNAAGARNGGFGSTGV